MACGYGPTFHTVKPTLLLDFAGRQNLLDRITGNSYITFTRSTANTGYYFDNTGKLVTAAANIPRFEYNPITRQCRGLLIEPQRTNYALQSITFNSTTWNKGNITFGGVTTTSPAGASISSLNVTATGYAYCAQNVTYLGTSGTACLSFYVKAGNTTTSCNNFLIRDSTIGAEVIATIDYSTGAVTMNSTVGTIGAGGSLFGSGASVAVGNGWWRVQVNITGGMVSGRVYRIYAGFIGEAVRSSLPATPAPGDPTIQETAGNYVFVWGAQFEDGENPSSLILTAGTTLSRGADVVTLGNFPSWYNNTQGCFLIDAGLNWPYGSVRQGTDAQFNTIFDIQVGSSPTPTNQVLLENYNGATDLTVESNGVVVTTLAAITGTWKPGVFNRLAFNYSFPSLSINGIFNAGAITNTSVSDYPTVSFNNMRIGSTLNGTNFLNGYIRSIAYYATTASTTNLYTMTIAGGTTGPTIEGGGGGGGGAVTL